MSLYRNGARLGVTMMGFVTGGVGTYGLWYLAGMLVAAAYVVMCISFDQVYGEDRYIGEQRRASDKEEGEKS